MIMQRRLFRTLALLLAIFLSIPCAYAQKTPKREFRGAWIQAVNGQFMGMTAAEMQKDLISQLDILADCGINVILFQVRVEGDALYKSDIEPWSAYLTGTQGTAPDEDWDPLRFMIAQCHQRGMELHAWINPYRAKTPLTQTIAYNHQMNLHPDRFVRYGNLVLFNPALKENRDYICSVAADIVTRYDIDGFHMDDYFYPFPENGMEFGDAAQFRADPRGFSDRGDWRRDNVNLLVEQLRNTILGIKPWVKFGISPFGIYRNASEEYPDGSATRGQENYSGLYADVLCWMKNGWIDYCIPQLYWNAGFEVADYEVLSKWWAGHSYGCPVYIGQDVERTVKGTDPDNAADHQERFKMNLQRSLAELEGSCHWPARSVVDNPKGYGTILKDEYYGYPALQPLSSRLQEHIPGKVRKVRLLMTSDGNVLFWTPPASRSQMDKAYRYVVYRYEAGEQVDVDDPSHIVCITDNTFFRVGGTRSDPHVIYAVTALSRTQAESKPTLFRQK